MNHKTKNIASNNHPTYYARAASTQGDKVKIYRFAMIQQCVDLSHKIINEKHPIKKAVLRQELAQFIADHIGEFSGDREQMINYASKCNLNTLHVIEDKVLLAERMTIYSQRTIAAMKKRPTANAKAEFDDLRKKLKKYSSLHRKYQQICPRYICDQTTKLADIFEYMNFPRY